MSKKFDGRTCPACGSRTLFIGSGGYVTCSWIECPQPDTSAAIEQLLAAASEEAARGKLEGLLKTHKEECNAKGYGYGCCDMVSIVEAAITPPTQGLAEEGRKS